MKGLLRGGDRKETKRRQDKETEKGDREEKETEGNRKKAKTRGRQEGGDKKEEHISLRKNESPAKRQRSCPASHLAS